MIFDDIIPSDVRATAAHLSKLELNCVPIDYEIVNCRSHYGTLKQPIKRCIDDKYKFVAFSMQENPLTKALTYLRPSMVINAYKVFLTKAVLGKDSISDAISTILRLTWQNFSGSKGGSISCPRDAAIVNEQLAKPPNWNYLIKLMLLRPRVELVVVNERDITDVRLYKPFDGTVLKKYIVYYNCGNVSLFEEANQN